jgi:FkbM family methyltransferase
MKFSGYARALAETLKLDIFPKVRTRLQPHLLSPIGDSFYFDHENYWEPNVVLACRDVIESGDVFWDIGANMGGITRLASRLVGPQGSVISVEASLGNYRKLNNNVIVNHLNNVFLIRAAMWNESGQTLTLYNGSGENDSLFASHRLMSSSEKVISLTLDDLLDSYGMPSVIKLDIEGAEYQALLGAKKLIDKSLGSKRPKLILEASNEDSRALELLLRNNYVLQDLATGKIWENFVTKHPDPISNWIAIPSELKLNLGYMLEPFDNPQILHSVNGTSVTFNDMAQGRYQIEIDIIPTSGESIYVCILNGSRVISRYHGEAVWISRSYANRQFDLTTSGELSVNVEVPNGMMVPTTKISKVTIREKKFNSEVLKSYVLAP